MYRLRFVFLIGLVIALAPVDRGLRPVAADEVVGDGDIYAPKNLVAWCIVPFDAERRGPQARAKMLTQLGIQRVAYDWRAEHVPSFEQEIIAYQQHGIEYFAFWTWHDSMEPLIQKYGIRPQIWYSLPAPSADGYEAKVAQAAATALPLAQTARRLGLKFGIYNHGGWAGEPANMVAVCQYLRERHDAAHVGIVYNFHHGHAHIADFAHAFRRLKPYLLCVNLNGMVDPQHLTPETKIRPISTGEHEMRMMQIVERSGYTGPIGILDHRARLDAEQSLRENLQGVASYRRAR